MQRLLTVAVPDCSDQPSAVTTNDGVLLNALGLTAQARVVEAGDVRNHVIAALFAIPGVLPSP